MGIHYGKADFINYGKPSLLLDFARNKSLVDRISGNNLITFERASTGTYVGADGLIKYAAADEARFDHDPLTGESLGLLIEQEGSNYFPNSQTLSDWAIDNASLTTNTSETLSPDGSNNALKLTATGSGVIQHDAVRLTGINNYQQSTFSVWLKTASGNGHFQMSIGNITYPGNASTGYLQVYGSYVEEYPNGWFRFSIRRNWGAATGGVTLGIHLNANSGNGGYGVIAPQSFEQSGEALYIWGAQWENKQSSSITTTYIPTSGSTLTRQPDIAQITGTNFTDWYNATEGTIFAEFSAKTSTTGYPGVYWFNNNLTANRGFALLKETSPQTRVFQRGDDGVLKRVSFSENIPDSTFAKASIFYTNSEIGGSQNNEFQSPTSITSPYSVNRLYIGFHNSGGGASPLHLNSHIKQLIYYPARISDIKLQQMTKVFS